ncbi:MAG: carboxypeptidase-like regulatory domain-containing protein [Bacteroidota bacterium]
MSKILIISILLLFVLYEPACAQEHKFYQINGIVTNVKHDPIPFVHILIKNKRMGKVGGYNGKFSFIAEYGDTVLFSSIGYKTGRYIVPLKNDEKFIEHIQILINDTIHLKEAVVFPWKNYQEFKKDFVEMDYIDDDMEKAYKNLAMISEQLRLYGDEMPAAPNACYRVFMNQMVYDKMYYAGQSQPIKIFDIIAWSQFFEAWKRGDFKKKKFY